MKELITKRSNLMKEWGDLKTKIATEKREYTTEERTRIDAIKSDVASLNSQIEEEKEFEAEIQRKLNAGEGEKVDVFTIGKPAESKDIIERTHSNLINFLIGKEYSDEFRGNKGKFFMPNEYLQRATVTTAAASQAQSKTLPVSIIEKGLFLQQLGAQLTFETGSGLKANYLSSAPASFGTEDSPVADQAYSAGAYDLQPDFVRAGYEISGLRLKQISQQSIGIISGSLQNRVYQALEKRGVDHAVSSSSNIVSGSTATTVYNAIVGAKNGVEYGNAFVMGKDAATILETARKDPGAGRFVMESETMLSYPAIATSLITKTNTVVFADWAHLVMNIWDGVELDIVRDVQDRKGNYIIEATAFADAKFGNPFASYVLRNVQSFKQTP